MCSDTAEWRSVWLAAAEHMPHHYSMLQHVWPDTPARSAMGTITIRIEGGLLKGCRKLRHTCGPHHHVHCTALCAGQRNVARLTSHSSSSSGLLPAKRPLLLAETRHATPLLAMLLRAMACLLLHRLTAAAAGGIIQLHKACQAEATGRLKRREPHSAAGGCCCHGTSYSSKTAGCCEAASLQQHSSPICARGCFVVALLLSVTRDCFSRVSQPSFYRMGLARWPVKLQKSLTKLLS